MTKSQLKQFYSFVHLPYGETSDNLDELKKILLLELKSTGDTINVNGKSWSKNDILDFFNSDFDNSLDLDAFLADYPWIKNLDTIDKIIYESYLTTIDFSDNRFGLFAKSEGKAKEDEFLRIFRNRIIAQEDYYAVAMLLYKNCFSPIFQLRLMNEAKALLLNRFNEIIALGESNELSFQELATKAKYITNSGFYHLMREIANDDSDLLYINLKVIYHIFFGFSQATILKIITDQLTLNHDDNSVAYLLRMREQVLQRMGHAKVAEKESETAITKQRSKVYKLIFILIAGMIIFSVIYRKYRENQLKNRIEFLKMMDEIEQSNDLIVIDTNLIRILEEADRNKNLQYQEFSRQVDSMQKIKKRLLNEVEYMEMQRDFKRSKDSIENTLHKGNFEPVN